MGSYANCNERVDVLDGDPSIFDYFCIFRRCLCGTTMSSWRLIRPYRRAFSSLKAMCLGRFANHAEPAGFQVSGVEHLPIGGSTTLRGASG